MAVFPEDPRYYVRSEYESRHGRNPAYSWRSFARDLKMSPSMLTEFLKGRYGFSRVKANHVADVLRLTPDHTEHFIDLLEAGFHRKESQRQIARLRVAQRLKKPATHVNREVMARLDDWIYFALLEIVGLGSGHPQENGWTAAFTSTLGRVRDGLTRLIDLGLILRKSDQMVPCEEVTIAGHDLSAADLKNLHDQVIGLGQSALTELPDSEREAISVFASIRSEDWPALRRDLNDSFLQILNKYSARGESDCVFGFNLMGFSVYRIPKDRET